VSDIDAVVDTGVLIEIFHGNDRARAWLARIASHVLGIPIFVYMEILPGARNKREQRALAAQLAQYTILHPESGDSPKAQGRKMRE
jgi:predicted nucleic acid-binding protein